MKLWLKTLVVGCSAALISSTALAEGPKCKSGFTSVSCEGVDGAVRSGFCWAEKKGEVSDELKSKRCMKKKKALSKAKKKMKKKAEPATSDES